MTTICIFTYVHIQDISRPTMLHHHATFAMFEISFMLLFFIKALMSIYVHILYALNLLHALLYASSLVFKLYLLRHICWPDNQSGDGSLPDLYMLDGPAETDLESVSSPPVPQPQHGRRLKSGSRSSSSSSLAFKSQVQAIGRMSREVCWGGEGV